MAEAKEFQPSLEQQDPEIYELIQREQTRQWRGLELIASENFTSRAVLEALGSCLTNKYSEGLPGARYYGGNEYIDAVERLAIARSLAAMRVDPKEWGCNVQPYSGSTANWAAYVGILEPHDRIMGLDLPSGGHLTHGYYTAKKKISATSIFFESYPYVVNAQTGLIDYDKLEADAKVFRPKLLIAGASAYPREWDYARMRKIADEVGAYLLMDMAHIAGLVAGGVAASPFDYCDIVTTTTHKSLRGPRASIIFYKLSHPAGLQDRINFAVFPSVQGGPHNNAIAGIAVQMKEAASPEFKDYAAQVKKNAAALADTLVKKGYTIATNGTDNHLILWNLRPQKVTGSKMSYLCDEVSITLNKNSIHGDQSALTPGGVRVGSPALTSRGLKEADFVKVGEFLDRACQLSVAIQAKAGPKLEDFKTAVHEAKEVAELRAEVEAFAKTFPMPGFDAAKLKYQS